MSVSDVAAVVAAVIAVASFLGPVRAYYNRTVGRRFDLYRRFERLGVGAHQSFFETVIGEAPAIRRSITWELPDYSELTDGESEPPLVEHTFTESLWVDPLFYARQWLTTIGRFSRSPSRRGRGASPRGLPPRVRCRHVRGCSRD